MLIKNNFPKEITRLLEVGVNKQLSRSIIYSPLRFFYNRFQKNNPRTIENARNIVTSDIYEILKRISGFNENIFVVNGKATENGKKFFRRIYNIGINLLKKKLSVTAAFKVLTNSTFRMQVYEFILRSVEKAIVEFVEKSQIRQKKPPKSTK